MWNQKEKQEIHNNYHKHIYQKWIISFNRHFHYHHHPKVVLYLCLSSNMPDKNGYYRNTLAKNMNWYVGTHKQSTPLPNGTVVLLKSCTTGADYPSRFFCSGYRKPGETKDTIKEFCIDFLTVGSMPSNRAIL